MKAKQLLKIITDILMTGTLLFLMAYSLVGQEAHEWLGVGMFALFVLHHLLNNKWCRSVFKGRYTPYRVLQTLLVVSVFAAMISSMVSGIILSRYAFSFMGITTGRSWARTLHMLSAYWGFAFLSLHLGLHWSMMVSMARKLFKKSSAALARVARAVGLLIAGYGVYAFVKRDVGSYMLLKTQFVFIGFDQSLVFFLLDYMAVMGLFVLVGHYLSEGLKRIGGKKNR